MNRTVTLWVRSYNHKKGSYWVLVARREADLANFTRCEMLCRREFERFSGIRVPAKKAVQFTVSRM